MERYADTDYLMSLLMQPSVKRLVDDYAKLLANQLDAQLMQLDAAATSASRRSPND